MSIRKHWRLGTVAVCCAAVGAGASAIANAGASTSGGSSSSGSSGSSVTTQHAHRAGGERRTLLRRAVSGNVVVATKSGYATVKFDRGTVKSVSGQRLTLAEGRGKKAPYRTATITIPSTARVRNDRHQATLADVKPGQRATVLQTPKRTVVLTRTPRTR
jgi:hypothetical protein